MDLRLQSHISLHDGHSDHCTFTFTFTTVPSTYITHLITFCSIAVFIFNAEYNQLRSWNFPTNFTEHFLLYLLAVYLSSAN